MASRAPEATPEEPLNHATKQRLLVVGMGMLLKQG